MSDFSYNNVSENSSLSMDKSSNKLIKTCKQYFEIIESKENTNYIYILKLREFIRTNENIYKIGRTSQNGLKRINQYPKGSELILFRKCINCVKLETELIKKFKLKYKHQPTYGNEYFEGHELDMVKDINKLIDDEINNEIDNKIKISNDYNQINKNNQFNKNNIISLNKLTKRSNTVIDLSKQIIINKYKDLIDITDNTIKITITNKILKSGYYQLQNDNIHYIFGDNMTEKLLDVLYNNFSYYSDIGYINIIDNNYISCNKYYIIIDENKDTFYKLIFYKIDYDNIITDILNI